MINAVILAAGESTRMKSKFSKVVHKVAGSPIIDWTVSVAEKIADDVICVVGKNAEEINNVLGDRVKYAVQEKRLGTGHAVMQAEKLLKEENTLVIGGDSPLITTKTLENAFKAHQKSKAVVTVITARVKNPYGYGRIIRSSGDGILSIVEEKDATVAQKKITEVNSGIYFFNTKFLKSLKDRFQSRNAQGEFYLTDSIKIAIDYGRVALAYFVEDEKEILGVNNREQLSHAEKILRKRIIRGHMERGVTFINPHTAYISKDAQIGMDTIIYPNTIIEGNTKIGADCTIIGGRIKDSVIGHGCHVEQSVILEGKMGHGVNIGPFAFIRPGTVIGNGNKVGAYVELKNSNIGDGTKVPHLTYIGDSDIGERVNFGCGSIVANYDGKKKYRSKVGNDAFIGSNVNLISPVEIGDKAFVAAGTTVTQNVPNTAFAIGRVRQENKEGRK